MEIMQHAQLKFLMLALLEFVNVELLLNVQNLLIPVKKFYIINNFKVPEVSANVHLLQLVREQLMSVKKYF